MPEAKSTLVDTRANEGVPVLSVVRGELRQLMHALDDTSGRTSVRPSVRTYVRTYTYTGLAISIATTIPVLAR